MSDVGAEPGTSSANGRGQTTLVSAAAAVAISVIVGWLAYYDWVYPHLSHSIFDEWTIHTMTGFYLSALVDSMVKYFAPYVLVLLLWGRTGRRRLGSALCALAVGMYRWGLWILFDKWVWGDNATSAQVRAYEWANLLVVSAGIALAWGIARRWGRIWLFGLLAAPIFAALTYELANHSSWWRTHLLFDHERSHDLTRQMVFIAPAVMAAMICWLIEVASTRRTSEPGPQPAPAPIPSL